MKSSKKKASVSRVSTEYGEVLLDEDTGGYWHLNQTASLVLQTLQNDGDASRAVQKLVEVYDVDPARAREDVNAIAERFAGLGVL